jgi:hypothetical protein
MRTHKLAKVVDHNYYFQTYLIRLNNRQFSKRGDLSFAAGGVYCPPPVPLY